MIDEKIKEAWRKQREDCSKIMYGDCQTLSCMAHDEIGKYIKPYVFVGCPALLITNDYVNAEARARMAEHHLHCSLTSEECASCRAGLTDYIKEVEAELST